MKTLAALNLPKPAMKVIALARSIVNAMTNHPSFPSPTPSLDTLAADIAALDEANAAVLTRTRGAREARDVKLAALRLDLVHLAAYVQTIADSNPETSAEMIQLAGMSVKSPSIRNTSPFTAADGAVSGSVRLTAKSAGDRASYEWQYSTDQETWNRAPTTLQASTVLTGLTPTVTYFFRFRALTKEGEGGFGPILPLVVR